MKHLSHFVICALLSLSACNLNRDKEVPVHSAKAIRFHTLKLDSLLLKPPLFSGNGFFKILSDSIHFLDISNTALLVFNREGKFCKRYLGKGEGPGETNGVTKLLNLKDGGHFSLSDYTYTLFGPDWKKLSTKQIDWEYGTADENELLNNPDPTRLAMYGFNWMRESDPCLTERSNNRIVLPISCEHPKLNGSEHEEYYKEVSTLGELDLNTGKIKTIFGRRSPQYLKNCCYFNFDFYQFEAVQNDSLIVSFAIDSLIYMYDNQNKLVKKFGVSGRDMKTDYPATRGNWEEVMSRSQEELKNYGYYDFLWFDKKNGLIFRSYKKGGSKLSGLQVYNAKYDLIADVDTPWNFQVIGFIDPYYYASGIIDEEKERLGIYRFTLQ